MTHSRKIWHLRVCPGLEQKITEYNYISSMTTFTTYFLHDKRGRPGTKDAPRGTAPCICRASAGSSGGYIYLLTEPQPLSNVWRK